MTDTLVIILCETRAFRLCQDNFKKNVLDQMNCDLALCVGINKTTEKTDNKYYSYAKYIWETEDPEDCGHVYDEIRIAEGGDPKWIKLLEVRNDMNLGGIRNRVTAPNHGSGAYLYYYRWLLLNRLRENNLIEKYKWFIVTRSDFIWKIPHPDTKLLNENNIYIPDGEKYGGVTDRHTILPAKYVETYLNIIQPILHTPRIVKEAYDDTMEQINPECFIKWWLEYNDIYKHVKFFPYVMYSVRERNGSSSWSYGNWNEDLGYYIKYEKEFESYQKFVDVFKSQQEWVDFYKCNVK